MQFYSTDGTFVKGSSPDVWTSEIVEALKVFGMEPEPGPKLEAWVREAGFVDVNHVLLPIPVGVWPRDKRMVGLGSEFRLVGRVLIPGHRKKSAHATSRCSLRA